MDNCATENEEDLALAFCMGLHGRLGADSCVRALDDDLARMIAGPLVAESRRAPHCHFMLFFAAR